ncbi:MAG: hypothetical protein B7Y97_08575 [Sphingomonas sp. 32-66-10]|nr:MAG: hypothetical protein B7Y97_08575 [Sphingomonas sp. 32-66-10]
MIARLILAVALLLGTLPASVAMPTCHDAPMAANDHAGMTMPMPMAQHDMPEPPRPEGYGDAMCVGCIAPSTLKVAAVNPPPAPVAIHGAAAPARGIVGALLTPEPPPPRG